MLHAIYSSLQLILLFMCIILIQVTSNFFFSTPKDQDVCKDYKLY